MTEADCQTRAGQEGGSPPHPSPWLRADTATKGRLIREKHNEFISSKLHVTQEASEVQTQEKVSLCFGLMNNGQPCGNDLTKWSLLMPETEGSARPVSSAPWLSAAASSGVVWDSGMFFKEERENGPFWVLWFDLKREINNFCGRLWGRAVLLL